MEKLRKKLVEFNRANGLSLRQSYSRQGPRLSEKIGRYAHARQFKRMKRAIKKQRTWMGRLERELSRQLNQLEGFARIEAEQLISQAKQLIVQSKDPKSKNKLYALHEPKVDCISKGKVHKRYEFGCKVGMSCTQEEGFVVGVRSYPGNPYDGHTKNEGLLDRCHLKGTLGDALHAILCGIGHNLRLIRNCWKLLILHLIRRLMSDYSLHGKAIVAF